VAAQSPKAAPAPAPAARMAACVRKKYARKRASVPRRANVRRNALKKNPLEGDGHVARAHIAFVVDNFVE
jgi:hypothetical protein